MNGDPLDRRDFLRHAALLGTGTALYPWSRSLTAASRPHGAHHPDLLVPPGPADLHQIEHVVILMQENRSYDHYFGSYPHGRGFDDHPKDDLGVFSQVDPRRTTGTPPGQLLPFHLNAAGGTGACTYDISHEWTTQHAASNGGRLDQWALAHLASDGRIRGPLTMGYYLRRDLPLYYALADAFTLCDHYFCSVLGPTDPNRHYAMSGTIDPNGRAGGPVVTNAPNVNAPPGAPVATNAALYSWTTMPERLQAQGVSWRVYQAPGTLTSTPTTNNILIRYRQYADPSTPLYQNAFLPTYPHDFVADVKAGTLPSVSWVNAPPNQDEHPPAPPNTGARVTGHVLQTLLSNPKIWAKTVLFVTFDENGGFFDHVAPPSPPPGTPDEYVTTPLPPEAGGVNGPIGLGFRVPMLVASPFSRGGHVNSDPFDHTSLLRFLETRFGVEVPNLSAWRRGAVSDLTSTLQLTRRPRLGALSLPYTGLSGALVDRECLNVGAVPPPPLHQRMPSQAR